MTERQRQREREGHLITDNNNSFFVLIVSVHVQFNRFNLTQEKKN